MYGHGYGCGYGRGYGRGLASGAVPGPAPGYQYVGSCRCGYGPNAHYRDPNGRVVSARNLFAAGSVQPDRQTAEAGDGKDTAAKG